MQRTLADAVSRHAELETSHRRAASELESVRTRRQSLEEAVDKHRRRIIEREIQTETDRRLIENLDQTRRVMREFLKRSRRKKIGRLAESVGESFRFLLRKSSLVASVDIDPESFAVRLVAPDGGSIPQSRLSEGEKQLFAVSFLWGLSRCASRRLPMIVDTPMGRLDADHRRHLIERYFPNASHQTIVLSTDTEIDRDAEASLQSVIARRYRLAYDEETRSTEIVEGYLFDAPQPSTSSKPVAAAS